MSKANPEQQTILRIYGALGAALVFSLVPSAVAALVSMILFLGVLIAAYMVRKKSIESSLSENHMIFIIRTIWIGSFIALVTMTAGSVYMFFEIDNTPIEPCAESLLGLAMNTDMMNMDGLMRALGPCMDAYWGANKIVFMISGALVAGPVLVYFAVRYARGLSRALGGYRVAQPLRWF